MSPEQIFATVLLASALSFGGMASLPVLQSALAGSSLPSEELILESFAVGNISPGPNSLYLGAFGYFAGGVAGWALACLAMLIPPVLILLIERLHARWAHRRRFRGALASVGFAVAALLLSASWSLLSTAVDGPLTLVVALLAAVMLHRGIPPLVAVALAALLGWASTVVS